MSSLSYSAQFFEHKWPAAIVGGVTAAALLVVFDYRAWLAFGTGGTPPNLTGYMRMSKFRLLRFWSGDDLKDASRLPKDGISYLSTALPKRPGLPPAILPRTLPQRQYPLKLDSSIQEKLQALPSSYAAKYPDLLKLQKSHTEGYSTDAIYAKEQLTPPKERATDRILRDEIAHVHPAENSLHVWLTKTDARKIVEAGWGERFPLASLGMVDDGWVFLYAPRSQQDLDVIDEIVRAGIAHLTGVTVEAC